MQHLAFKLFLMMIISGFELHLKIIIFHLKCSTLITDCHFFKIKSLQKKRILEKVPRYPYNKSVNVTVNVTLPLSIIVFYKN